MTFTEIQEYEVIYREVLNLIYYLYIIRTFGKYLGKKIFSTYRAEGIKRGFKISVLVYKIVVNYEGSIIILNGGITIR